MRLHLRKKLEGDSGAGRKPEEKHSKQGKARVQ